MILHFHPLNTLKHYNQTTGRNVSPTSTSYYVLQFDRTSKTLKLKVLGEYTETLVELLDSPDLLVSAESVPLWFFILNKKFWGDQATQQLVSKYVLMYSQQIYQSCSNKLDLTKYTGDLKLVFTDILGRTKTIELAYFSDSSDHLYQLKVYTNSQKTTEVKQGEIHSNTELYYWVEPIT